MAERVDEGTQDVAALSGRARGASYAWASASSEVRDRALRLMADALLAARASILAANDDDVSAAAARGTAGAMLDRLRLDDRRLDSMADALREVATLADPLGRVEGMVTRPNGLRVGRRRIPLGVVGFIYEARPNVTSDAAGLCLKSGNAVVLKGGSEAHASNRAIVAALKPAIEAAGLPGDGLAFVDRTDRGAVGEMLACEDEIDLMIPRGGEGLIRFVAANAKMPVLKHYKGVCHVFLERSADLQMATEIVVNAKVQRPSVCNAAETLLVDAAAAKRLLPTVAQALAERGVTLHACQRSIDVIADAIGDALGERLTPAQDDDWRAEYLSLDIAVRVVDDIDDAIGHIRRYGSLHTEAIVTQDYASAERFLDAVDSSTVLVNASTRFADGGQLGLGAEIGISTTRLHAFGPMGLEELTTRKFVVYGHGQVRS